MYLTREKHCNLKTVCKSAIRFALFLRTFLLLCVCAAPVVTEAALQSSNKWQLLPAPSAGDVSLTLSLKAEKAVEGWMTTSVPLLTIHCEKGKSAIYVETGMALEVTMVDKQFVRLQFDNKKLFAQNWREVTNATVSARDASTLIRQLVQSQKFIFEFTPFSSSPVQAEFTVVGLSAYLPQLTKACW
ncbi:MAG: hypothetical protein WCA63_01735 [Gallionella sp.]